MYLVCWLCFLTLEKYPFVGDILCVPATNFSLVTRAVCSRGASCVGFLSPSVVVGRRCGQSGELVWLLVHLLARPCLLWRLLVPVGKTESQGG